MEAPAPWHKHFSPPSEMSLIISPLNENPVNFAWFCNVRQDQFSLLILSCDPEFLSPDLQLLFYDLAHSTQLKFG